MSSTNTRMKNFFLLIVSDGFDFSNQKKSAFETMQLRLESLTWPIYQRTPNKDIIKSGDECLVYIAGKGLNSRHIVCTFEVEEIDHKNISAKKTIEIDMANGTPIKYLVPKEIIFFDNPVYIPSLLSKLSFIKKNKQYWGAYLQGGCKKITPSDFNLIVNQASASC